ELCLDGRSKKQSRQKNHAQTNRGKCTHRKSLAICRVWEVRAGEDYSCSHTESVTRATCAISATSWTRTMCAPLRMLAATVAAVPHCRSLVGAGLPFLASVAPRNPLRDVPTRIGKPSLASSG